MALEALCLGGAIGNSSKNCCLIGIAGLEPTGACGGPPGTPDMLLLLSGGDKTPTAGLTLLGLRLGGGAMISGKS